MSSEFISREKRTELETELEFLKTTRRKELAENLQRARALGDLSENAEYHAAREEQGYSEDRIKEIEYTLKNAKVIDASKVAKNSGVVSVGSKVEIKKKGAGGKWEIKTRILEIVGGEESDLLAGKVSYKSPLGVALMGQVEGVEVSVITPKGEVKYKTVSVK
jgi:transcription elongation factor GreA